MPTMFNEMKLTTRLVSFASQENCDGEEYDAMIEASNKILQLESQIELLTNAAMKGGANKAMRDAIDLNPDICLNQIKSEAIGNAMQSIDMNNFKMGNKTDPVVLRYMGELARHADQLFKAGK